MAASAYYAQVQFLYVAYFGRPADKGGLEYYASVLEKNGGKLQAMLHDFAASAESKALYSQPSLSDQIVSMYQTLFGRAADMEGVTYWANQVRLGNVILSEVAAAIAYNAQAADKAAFQAKLIAAEAFTAKIDTVEKLVAYETSAALGRVWLAPVKDASSATEAQATIEATLAAVVAGNGANSSYVLQTGADNATANQFFASQTYHNVDGKGPTLNTGDYLRGTAGRTDNTLTITDLTAGVTNGNIPAGVKLENIQNVILNSSNNTAASGFSTREHADVRKVTVTTAGNNNDVVVAGNNTNGVPGQQVTVQHNSTAGGTVTVLGGSSVDVLQNSNAQVLVGLTAVGTVPNPANVATGAINVVTNSTGGGAVNVVGGSQVTVQATGASYTGAIHIGNTGTNTGNSSAGGLANTAGDILVKTAGTGAITAFGGKDVTIESTGINGQGAIIVGDATAVIAGNLPTGNVTITQTAQYAYDGIAGAGHNNAAGAAITVAGGKDITITTNSANNINVGNLGTVDRTSTNPTGNIVITNTGLSSAAAAAAINVTGGADVTVTSAGGSVSIGQSANGNAGVAKANSNPTGNVVVTETANSAGLAGRTITVDGGKDVTVTAKGQNVVIGANALGTGAPTGAVLVNQADIFTGNGAYLNGTAAGNVTVNGGTTVTVNTTGGNVTVGGVVASKNLVPTGDVTITRKASGPLSDTTSVQGGAKVAITSTQSSGDITVGANSAVLNVAGTGLKDAVLAPTGDVTIVNATTAGANVAYGTGNVNVNTNGAQTVSIKGGDVDSIIDVQSTLATGGANAGKAVGTSTLKNVVIDGLQNNDGVAIRSDALANLTVTNSKALSNTITITNNTEAHDLTITQGGNTAAANTIQVVDAKAGKVTITDNGTASTSTLRVDATKATEVTVSNAAAAALQIGAVASDIAKVTLKGAGNVTFNAGDVFGTGNLNKALTVDASAATGNVTSSMQAITEADKAQQYLGGSGVDTVTVNSNASGWGNLVKIDGGNGSADVLVANYAALGTDVAMGNAAAVKGFEILRLGANANSAGGNYDAAGFSEVQVGAVAGNILVTNAASGATLSVTANTGAARTIGFSGANTTGTNNSLTVKLGTAGTAAAPGIIDANTGIITANGIENLTVNAVGGFTSATRSAATNLTNTKNVVEINGAATNGAATLKVTGDKSLELKSNTGFTSINASENTGIQVDVTGAKVSNAGVTFTGGASKLIAAGSNDTGTFKSLVTVAGTGTALALNNQAVVNINGTTFTYTATGNATATEIATALAAAINAGATTGPVAMVGGNPGVTATVSGGNIVLTKNAAFEVQTSLAVNGGAALPGTTSIADSLVGGQQMDAVALAVTGALSDNETVSITINGTAYTVTVLAAASAAQLAAGTHVLQTATAADIATAIAKVITAAAPAGIASATASGANVLVTSQLGQTNLVSVAETLANGTATQTASVNFATVNNVFVTGAGGGEYTAGLGGSWNTTAHKFSSGSETVTLDASTAKVDTLKLTDGAVVTDNGSKGGVTKFVVDSQAASDVLTIGTANNQTKTILKNAVTGVVNTVNGAAAMAAVLDSSGALNTALANLTFTISNGVITFGATGGNSLSQFTVNQLINAAQILVSSTTTGGADMVVAFSHNGRSYVVASDAANTLAAGVDSKSTIVELKDVASVKGFGSTFGEGTVVASNVNLLTGSAANNGGTAIDLTALATSSTLDYKGFAKATLSVTGTNGANTNVTKFQNLAASAELAVAAAGNANLGLLETTQVGAAGHNSLTVSFTGNTTLDRLSVSGDAMVKFANGAGTGVVTELVDVTNTLNTVEIAGGVGAFTLSKVTGTALTTVDATKAGGTFNFASLATPDAHNGLTMKLAAGQAANIWTSGANNTFTQTAEGTGVVTLRATGSANTIDLANGANVVTANGAGNKITVGTGSNTITATGADGVINIASGAGSTVVTVGTNATVNIGTAATANAGAETVNVSGAVTGGVAGSHAQTVINFATGVAAAGTMISFDDGLAGASPVAFSMLNATSQINVSSATSLTEALNMAANYTALVTAQGTDASLTTLAANTGLIDWFQYEGNTYIVAMVNNTGAVAQQTGLDANDIVVKLTGLHNIGGFAGEVLTLA